MNFLKKLAPLLSTGLSLAGPYGAIASKLLAPILGMKPGAKPDDYAVALAGATPEQIEAIKLAEQNFQIQMKQLDINSAEEMEKLVDDDRAGARNMEIQTRDSTPRYGFYLITLGFFGTLIFVIVHQVQDSAKQLVDVMIGSLGTAWIQSVAYFFGSSRGSDEKTNVIADIAKAP